MDDADRKEIKRVAAALERLHGPAWRLAARSFLQGFMSLLGAAAASTLLLILAGFLFQRAGGTQLLAPFVTQLQRLLLSGILP